MRVRVTVPVDLPVRVGVLLRRQGLMVGRGVTEAELLAVVEVLSELELVSVALALEEPVVLVLAEDDAVKLLVAVAERE